MFVQIGCLVTLLHITAGFPSSNTPQITRYDGHKVLDILHHAEEDYLKILSMVGKYELDFWSSPRHVNDSMKVQVAPQYLEAFLKELEMINVDVSTMVHDVQQLIEESQEEPSGADLIRSLSMNSRISSSFYTYDQIQTFIFNVAGSSLPNDMNAQIEHLGDTNLGNEINMVKLSKTGSAPDKRKIFIDGGIHAREWVAPMTVLYIIEQLAFNPSARADINTLMDRYDVYLVPLVNPDGYKYSHTNERMWRKNRSPNTGSSCVGTDLNRNFPHMWNPGVGGSTNPCDIIYSGTNGNSELETQAITSYLQTHGSLFDSYITIHSFGQMWLYPWGYTSALPADFQDLHNAAFPALATICGTHAQCNGGASYQIGSSTNVLYAAAGGSDDWAKGGAGIKYSYTIELRDTGRYGFALPTSLILPTASEFFNGFLTFSNAMFNIEAAANNGK